MVNRLSRRRGIDQAGLGCRIWSRDHVSLNGSDHVRDSVHRRTRIPLVSWGGHLNLHVGGNRRRNHWLLVLMLVVAVTLLRWLLLLMMLVVLLLLLRMRSDLRMRWGARHCHGNSRRLWRHRGFLLHLLAWFDLRFCHGGSGQFLMAALPAALGSVFDLRMGVALGDAVSGLSWLRLRF